MWRGPEKELTVENGHGWIVCSRVGGGHAFGAEFRPKYGAGLMRRDEREETWTRLGPISVAARFLQISSQRSCPPPPPPMLFYIPPFTRNQANPSRCNFWCKVRPEWWSPPCRKAEVQARSVAVTPDKAAVSQTNEMCAWIAIDTCCILVRRSRTRRFRDPPAGSVLEEHDRTDQSNPSRSPRSPSGLLGYGR